MSDAAISKAQVESLLAESQAARHAGDAPLAEAKLWSALKLDPNNDTAALNLASLLFDRAKFDECKGLANVVIERAASRGVKPHPAAHLFKSRIAFAQQQPDEGLEQVSIAASIEPENPEIGAELSWAAQRRYWSYDPLEFREMFEAATAGNLDAGMLTRLVHQAFAKIVRPRLLELLVAEDAGAVAATERWLPELDDKAREDLGVLTANFEAAVAALHAEAAYQPRDAVIGLRDGSELTVHGLSDTDPLLAGSFFMTGTGAASFAFSAVESLEFGPVGEVMRGTVRLADGQEITGWVPLLNFFTMFSKRQDLRSGQRSAWAQATPNVRLPLGLRVWMCRERLLPLTNIAWVRFE